MRTHLLSLALTAGICMAFARAAEPQKADPIRAGRADYSREKAAIEKALQAGMHAAGTNYLNDLKTVARQMEAQGDEFGIGPAKAEIRRFEQSRTVPSSSDAGTPGLARTR